MAVRTVLHYPNPQLRLKAAQVGEVDANIKELISDMYETMYEGRGVGLAATQIDAHHRIFIMDMSRDQSDPITFINPEIVERSGSQSQQEGCLSFPGIFATVERAQKIQVNAMDEKGRPFSREIEGYNAVCVQHELDHLDGVLFIDYLSRLKRERLLSKYAKLHKITY